MISELDFEMQFEKIHLILDEFIQGGMIVETDKNEIMDAITEMEKLEKLKVDNNVNIIKRIK